MDRRKKKILVVLIFHLHMLHIMWTMMMCMYAIAILYRQKKRTRIGWVDKVLERFTERAVYMNRMVWIDDPTAINNLRMDQSAFRKLCDLLCRHGRLRVSTNVGIDEMVASFLYALGHDGNDGESSSSSSSSNSGGGGMHFNAVLCGVIRLHEILLKKPVAIREDCSDERWKWFKV